ncbi:aldo/keto reductase [Streptomyces sp. H27-G5]|uniref:aldo/keto reductase n=1 Tax=Streptomyces sp. H27-G5 TaxID=2996698 RepID=UPI002D1E35C8|nr:aldo/keto reductase [Streptomyces sp. H27-G5]
MRQILIPVQAWRNEVVISTRVGLGTHPMASLGFGSRKHLLSSLDRFLHQTGLDYLDILYAHRYDRRTPMDETVGALVSAVQQGKVLYVGLSDYAPSALGHANRLLHERGVPAIAYQTSYSLLDQWADSDLLSTLSHLGIGVIACAPLGHAALTPGRPVADSASLNALAQIATARGQTLPQLALSWVLRNPIVTSALLSTTCPQHLIENISALDRTDFTPKELATLEQWGVSALAGSVNSVYSG